MHQGTAESTRAGTVVKSEARDVRVFPSKIDYYSYRKIPVAGITTCAAARAVTAAETPRLSVPATLAGEGTVYQLAMNYYKYNTEISQTYEVPRL